MAAEQGGAVRVLARSYVAQYPAEAGALLERWSTDDVVTVLSDEPPATAAGVLGYLLPDVAAEALEALPAEHRRALLTEMDPHRAAACLARLPDDRRAAALALLDRTLAGEVERLLTYPPDAAGSLMDPRAVALRPSMTVGEAVERIRARRGRRVLTVLLVDEAGRLVGTIDPEALLLAAPEDRLETLNQGILAVVSPLAQREEVVEAFDLKRLVTLPVVDVEGRLLGVIRHDALLAAAREEATLDLQTMVGAGREERALSPVSVAVRKRLPWLEINLLTAFLAAAVVGLFEDTISRYTALAVLLPVVAGQSGNTGAQALAVTMRGLALREVGIRQWLRVAVKETNVGFLNGVAVAASTATAVWFWSGSVGLVLVIGLSMVLSMVAAGLAGAVIPMVLTRLGQDPAQSSSIVLTTVTDVVGFFSFLGIATLLAHML